MKAVVDRIEGELAVIAGYDDPRVMFNLPLEHLPAGLREGDHLQVEFRLDAESRAAETARVASLLEDLTRKGSD